MRRRTEIVICKHGEGGMDKDFASEIRGRRNSMQERKGRNKARDRERSRYIDKGLRKERNLRQ